MRANSKGGSHSNFQSRILKKRGTEQNEHGPPSGLGHASHSEREDPANKKENEMVAYVSDTLTKPLKKEEGATKGQARGLPREHQGKTVEELGDLLNQNVLKRVGGRGD